MDSHVYLFFRIGTSEDQDDPLELRRSATIEKNAVSATILLAVICILCPYEFGSTWEEWGKYVFLSGSYSRLH